MLNNGFHYVVDLHPDVAQAIGVAPEGSVWPSKLNDLERSKLFMLCDTVKAVDVRACCIYSFTFVKQRRASDTVEFSIRTIDVYNDEDLQKILSYKR